MFVIIIAAFVVGALFALGLHTFDKVNTEIEIDASSDEVWDALTTFSTYADWNPFITRISGDLSEGATTAVTIALPFSKSLDFKLKLARVDNGKEFVWTGKLLEPIVLDSTHTFRIETITPGKVKFSQEEKFSGLLLYIVLPFIKGTIERNFVKMNQALKNRVEGTTNIQTPTELQSGAV